MTKITSAVSTISCLLMAVIVTAAVGGKLKQKNIHAEIVQNLIENLPESMRPLI